MRAATPVILSFIVMATPAHAEEWWMVGVVGEPAKRIVFFADAEVLTVDGYRHLWTEQVREQKGEQGESVVSELLFLDCDRRRFATVERFMFDSAGKGLPRTNVIPEWTYVPPSTMVASLMKFGCNAERPSSGNIGTQDRKAVASARVFSVSKP